MRRSVKPPAGLLIFQRWQVRPRMPTFRHLFVYGTLVSNATSRMGRVERRRLRQQTSSSQVARVKGRLIVLGDYPGLISANATTLPSSYFVYGELLVLKSPSDTLAWLDAYEGLGMRKTEERAEFIRTRINVLSDTGARNLAWAYTCCLPRRPIRTIHSGKWQSTG